MGLAFAARVGAASVDESLTGWQLAIDNDVFVKRGSDRWYTNGIRATWTYGGEAQQLNLYSQQVAEAGKWFLWCGARPAMSYALGQTMYTPRNIRLAAPQLDDRPWGAFLYFGTTAHAFRKQQFRATEFKWGVTGPAALGRQAQTLIHELIDSPKPQGWAQQLRARPGVQLSHSRVYRFGDDESRPDWFAFQWGAGASVGTLRTYATGSVAILVGDLKGPNTPLLLGNEGDFVVQDYKRKQLDRPFAFLMGTVAVVGYNYFIEGPTPYGHSRIESKPSYAMWQWGFSLPLQAWLSDAWPRLSYVHSSRSAEFSGSKLGRGEAVQRWGTLAASWEFR